MDLSSLAALVSPRLVCDLGLACWLAHAVVRSKVHRFSGNTAFYVIINSDQLLHCTQENSVSINVPKLLKSEGIKGMSDLQVG